LRDVGFVPEQGHDEVRATPDHHRGEPPDRGSRKVTEFNFADVWELCASVRGPELALVCGTDRTSWSELDLRADSLARTMLDAGLGHQDKVAQYLYNCNEYLESMFALFKASLVPVNTNYRYGDDELYYLWDNADATAVIFHGEFTAAVDRVRTRLDKLRLFLHVDDGTGPCPDWAVPYEEAATALGDGSAGAAPARPVRSPEGRSGDDLYMLYTGGTTGMPKGVMWRQDDLFGVINSGSPMRLPADEGLASFPAAIEGLAALDVALLPACPLMHGTGAFTAIAALDAGGRVVTMPDHRLDPVAILETVAAEKIRILTIVGDAFARPILAELDRHPDRYDISSLMGIISSGVMWSAETKRGLLRHNPNMLLVDAVSSSEAVGLGASVSTGSESAETATFRIGPNVKVIDEEDREIPLGSGRVGRLAIRGRVPIGYYKDPERTARTFPLLDGERYSVPGDYATVDEDGTVHLLGRGSVVINTGGEKVFPEEVEEGLKTHPAVMDAAAVGVPDERFGETVAAVVELADGASVPPEELIAHVKEHLASYKAPRKIVFVPSIGRSPSGKLDYPRLREAAAAAD
jgi:fatty-acyl-CoA synthase